MITADQLKDVCQRVEALNKYLNIDQKKIEFEEEQLRTQAPDFWDDPKRAEVQMKKVKGIEKWLNGYKECSQLAEELQLAFDFYKGGDGAVSFHREKYVASGGGFHGCSIEDQLWCRWYRESGLG